MQGIYRILNLVNDKWYVGSASDIGQRWENHKRDLRGGNANVYLQNAFNKYGAKHFVLEILMEVKGSRQEAFDKEQEYLGEWMPTGLLYNISLSANGGAVQGTGWHHTEETIAKISKTRMGQEVSEETRAVQHIAGLKRWESPAERKKQSERLTGMVRSEENKANLRASWTDERKAEQSEKSKWSDERKADWSKRFSGENHPMYGKSRSEEAKAKQSKTWQKKGGGHWARNKQSKEHVVRRVESRKKSWTPEKSAAQSTRSKACWADPEVRARLTEWWADPERKATHSKSVRKSWTPERRKAHGELLKQGWTPEKRIKNGKQSKKNWAAAGPERKIAAAERMGKNMAKPYPAFYNIKTKELIPVGINLSKLCRDFGLSAGHLSNIATGTTKKTRDGWRLATEEEIKCHVVK